MSFNYARWRKQHLKEGEGVVIKFSDQKFKRVCHVTCDNEFCKCPISLVLTQRYGESLNEDLSIVEAEELIKFLQLAIEKAKLLKPEEEEE